MTARRATSVLAILSGGVMLAAGVATLITSKSTGMPHTLEAIGLAGALLTTLIAGYLLVAKAPIWLRIIVATGFPLLAAAGWNAVDPVLLDHFGDPKGSAVGDFVAGVILLGASLRGWVGQRPTTPHGKHAGTPS